MYNQYNHAKQLEVQRQQSLQTFENNDRHLKDLEKPVRTEFMAIAFASILFGIPAICLVAFYIF